MTVAVALLVAFSVLVSLTTSPGPGCLTLRVIASSAAKAPPAVNRPAARSARNRRMLLLRGGTGWTVSERIIIARSPEPFRHRIGPLLDDFYRPAGGSVDRLGVIDAHGLADRGHEVAGGDRPVGHARAIGISLTDDLTAADAAAG